jgi:uncharacterized membrane protein YgcG
MVDVTGEPKPEREQLAGPWSITSHTAWQLEDGGEAFRCCSAADADRSVQDYYRSIAMFHIGQKVSSPRSGPLIHWCQLMLGQRGRLVVASLAQGGAVGTWHEAQQYAFLYVCSVPLVDDALLLHGRMWAAVHSAPASGSGGNGGGGGSGGGNGAGSGSGGSSSLTLEAGLLLGDGRCVAARRTFEGDRLAATAFTAAAKQ